jgi:protein PhnA
MSSLPPCPKCKSEYTYEDRDNLVCPECAHEWPKAGGPVIDVADEGARIVRDANGNVLQDGDSVILIKELKVKGAPSPLKAGTKVKKIRLVEGDHNIDCKIDGFGAMQLKSELVRKA